MLYAHVNTLRHMHMHMHMKHALLCTAKLHTVFKATHSFFYFKRLPVTAAPRALLSPVDAHVCYRYRTHAHRHTHDARTHAH
jgi:hypothetical protein